MKPSLVNLAEYEQYMLENLPNPARDYYRSGANDMVTLQENRVAFNRYNLMPRILVDVSKVNLTTKFLKNYDLQYPIAIAPTAMQCMAHEDGEIASAKAAEK